MSQRLHKHPHMREAFRWSFDHENVFLINDTQPNVPTSRALNN